MRLQEPLLIPAGAVALGIVVERVWPGPDTLALLATMALGAIAAACWRRYRGAAAVAGVAALVGGGMLLDAVHRPGRAPTLDVADRTATILEGCVVGPPMTADEREQFVLQLAPGALAQVKIFRRSAAALPELHYGQRVEMVGQVRSPHNYQNPGGFDYTHFLARQHIYWSASGAAEELKIMPGACGNTLLSAVFRLRQAALARLDHFYRGNPYNIGMMQALLLGETARLQRSWTADYRVTGTFHALVISGSHVAVLAGTLLLLLRLCFVPRQQALLLVVALAWLYAVITGWQAPVIRSAAGMSLYALGGLFYRRRRMLNILAAVALGFMACDPESLLDPSFQLSFGSVALIAVFAVPWMERTSGPLAAACRDLPEVGKDPRLAPAVACHRVELRLLAATLALLLKLPLRWAQRLVAGAALGLCFGCDLMLTSAAVQAGLLLPMVIYFHRVPFSGLLANAFAVPLLGVVIPLGFAALFTGWGWIAKLAGGLLAWTQALVSWHARLEPNWHVPTPPLWLSMAIVVALLVAAVRWHRAPLRWGAAVLAFCFLALLVWSPFGTIAQPGVLEMSAIDVGQGDCLLLALPDGRTMLVDAGGIATFGLVTRAANLDIGEDVVAPYLWWRGVRRIDIVAISHLHDDHVGGMPAILKDFDVGEIWTGATPDCPAWRTIQALAAARGVRITELQRGDWRQLGAVRVNVLAPSRDYHPGSAPKNNDSLVFQLSYGRHSFLLTGDAEKQVEADLVLSGLLRHADVLKAGHHGSKTSSTVGLLDAVHPALALISDGYGNSYGHPHAVTLEHLQERHIGVLRTDQSGLLTVKSDGRRLWAEVYRP